MKVFFQKIGVLLLLSWGMVGALSAQGLNLNVALKYQIMSPGSTGTSPNFTVGGYVGDDLSRWDAQSVAIGDSVYVLDGPDLYVFLVSGINSAGGNALNINVTALNNNLSQIPPGQAAIIRPTAIYKLPTFISTLRDDLRSAIINRLSQLIDQSIAGGGADGVVTGGTYDGTNLSLTRSIGGSVNMALREVVNTTANPSGAPGTGEKVWINSSTGNMWYASGGAWVPLPGVVETVEHFASVTGTTIATAGPLPTTNTTARIKVYRTGIELTETVDYTISGDDVLLVLAAQAERFTIRYK